MEETKKKKKGKGHILTIQILAVLFLLLGIYLMITSWQGLSASAADYGLDMMEVLDSVIPSVLSSGCPYFGFASILYAISLVLEHQHKHDSYEETAD